MKTPAPWGYSRQLQVVRGTGRMLILAADGFWTNRPNPVYYADVDLGHSAGAYYKLVNRNSGKVLDVSQANLQDGGNVVPWADTEALDQQWQLVQVP